MKTKSSKTRAFTLVEIMIVVAIVGLLLAIAMPAYKKIVQRGRVVAYAGSLKAMIGALEMYAMDYGDYPDDVTPGVAPAGIREYIPNIDWSAQTPLGGVWDWERDAVGISAGLSALGPSLDPDDFILVDRRIDDGDLDTGSFRRLNANRYTFVIDE
jgi:prepilin-type N-terminal cleavage/methylation domain-containing protein